MIYNTTSLKSIREFAIQLARGANVDGVKSLYQFLHNTLDKAYFTVLPFDEVDSFNGKDADKKYTPLIDWLALEGDKSLMELNTGNQIGISSESALIPALELNHLKQSKKISQAGGWPYRKFTDLINALNAAPRPDQEHEMFQHLTYAVMINRQIAPVTGQLQPGIVRFDFRILSGLTGRDVPMFVLVHGSLTLKYVQMVIRYKIGTRWNVDPRDMIFHYGGNIMPLSATVSEAIERYPQAAPIIT